MCGPLGIRDGRNGGQLLNPMAGDVFILEVHGFQMPGGAAVRIRSLASNVSLGLSGGVFRNGNSVFFYDLPMIPNLKLERR